MADTIKASKDSFDELQFLREISLTLACSEDSQLLLNNLQAVFEKYLSVSNFRIFIKDESSNTLNLVLILVGIIYIIETLSDILQVTYFKLTHGKRIFRMAPIHHHFEMGGWSEVKIFSVFTGITVVMCILAWLGIFHRFG